MPPVDPAKPPLPPSGAKMRKRPDPMCWKCLTARMQRVLSNAGKTLAVRCPVCGLVQAGDGGLRT